MIIIQISNWDTLSSTIHYIYTGELADDWESLDSSFNQINHINFMIFSSFHIAHYILTIEDENKVSYGSGQRVWSEWTKFDLI